MKHILQIIITALLLFPSSGFAVGKEIVVEENYNKVAADVLVEKGFQYALNGEFDDAIEAYTAAIALDQNYAMAHNYRGHIYYLQRKYEEAIEDFNKAVTIDPNDSSHYISRGEAYTDKHQYDKAIEDFNKAISLDPENAQTYIDRGYVYELVLDPYSS